MKRRTSIVASWATLRNEGKFEFVWTDGWVHSIGGFWGVFVFAMFLLRNTLLLKDNPVGLYFLKLE